MRRGPAAVFLKLLKQLRDDAFPLAAMLPDAAAALLPLVGDVPVAGAVKEPVRDALPAGRCQGVFEVDAQRPGPPLRRCAAASGPCRVSGPTSGMAPS